MKLGRCTRRTYDTHHQQAQFTFYESLWFRLHTQTPKHSGSINDSSVMILFLMCSRMPIDTYIYYFSCCILHTFGERTTLCWGACVRAYVVCACVCSSSQREKTIHSSTVNDVLFLWLIKRLHDHILIGLCPHACSPEFLLSAVAISVLIKYFLSSLSILSALLLLLSLQRSEGV